MSNFEDVLDLGVDTAIQLGGFNKKLKKDNPTTAEGYYIGSRDIPSKFSKTGFSKLHVFSQGTVGGTPVKGSLGVFGKTDLDSKMAVVEVGARTRLTNTGSVPTNKGNDMLKYRVQVDRSDAIDVSSIAGTETNTGGVAGEEETQYADGGVEETDLDSEETQVDELPPVRATRPATPAQAPSAARQAQVQALLNKGRATRTA